MTGFVPINEVDLFCRFCEKVLPAQLDRSIAENGRVVDRGSTFEYYCTKCFKTACFTGNDLLELPKDKTAEITTRDYSPKSHYVIGEKIKHKVYKQLGTVVGKDNGQPSRILVNFPKDGLKKLVQDLPA